LAALLAAPANARAQQPPEQEATEDLLFADIPSVFGASKFEQLVTEAPASVTVFTADDIDRYGWRTLSDVLNAVRGFYISTDRAYDYMGTRGFSRPGDYNSRLLVLVDGHRTNESVYESAYSGYEALVDVRLIDRVEVIRGPSSSLYGTSAFFGVVNIVTKRGRDFDGARAWGEVASFGTLSGAAAAGGRWGGVELLAGGRYLERDGEDLYFPEYDDPQTNDGIETGTDAEEAGNVFAKLSAGGLTVEGGYSSRWKHLPAAPYGVDFNSPVTRVLDRRGFARVQYDADLGAEGRLSVAGAFDAYQYEGFYPYDDVVNHDDTDGRWWTGEAQYTRRIGAANRLVLGGQYRLVAEGAQRNEDQDPYFLYFADSTTTDTWGVFAQDELRLGALLLNAGLRYDHFETFGGTLNPRLAVIVAAGPSTTLKALYGRAFRAPNNYELYYNDGFFQKGNPDLEPERIATYEFLAEQFFARRLRAVAAVYQYDIDALISETVDPDDGLLVFRNLDEVRGRGLELELEADAGRVMAAASYAYQKAWDPVGGDELSNSPRHLAKFRGSGELDPGRLFAAVEVLLTSDRLAVDGSTVDGAVPVNLTITAREYLPGLRLAAGVYNLFDADYADPVSAAYVPTQIRRAPRTLRAEVSWGF
jgi:iron complex outermembrane receptor protein